MSGGAVLQPLPIRRIKKRTEEEMQNPLDVREFTDELGDQPIPESTPAPDLDAMPVLDPQETSYLQRLMKESKLRRMLAGS